MKLPRPPQRGPLRSWFLWNALHPNVRALTRSDDVDGLLAIVMSPRSADEEDQFSERALAACALGSFPGEAAVGGLAPLLAPAESTWVRVCAADSLRKIGIPAAGAASLPGLHDKNWAVQNAAIKTLEKAHHPDAWPALAALVTSDAGPLIRSNAAGALGEAKSDAWIPTLEIAVADPNLVVALGGTGGLINTESPAALDSLRRLRRQGRLILRPIRWLGYWKLRRVLRRRSREAR